MGDDRDIVLIKSGRFEDSIRLPKEINALKKEKFKIDLISWDQACKSKRSSNELRDFNLIEMRLRIPKGSKVILLLPIWWLFVIAKLIRMNFDLIHAIDIDSIIPALIVGKIKGKPVIYEMLDICEFELILPERIKQIILMVDKAFMSLASYVIVVDEEQTVGLGGVPNSNLATIYDSPPLEYITNSKPIRRKDREFILFSVGIFFKSKRLHLDKVVEAIKDLENVKLIIAGYGDMVDQIKAWSAEMPGKVEFIGRIKYSDVFTVGAASDLMFVLRDPIILSNKYTCGSTFLSAMMLGRPVLANEGTSTAEKVKEDNCGMVIDSNSVEDIKKAIIALKENPEFCIRLGDNARDSYNVRYNWALMENRLLDVYNTLLYP